MNSQPACVSTVKVNNRRNQEEIRQKMYRLLDNPRFRPPTNATILIKVNLCLLAGPETGGTVDPFLVECLVDFLQQECQPKEIIIAESDATHLEADMAFQILGWLEMFESRPGVRLLNLSKDELVEVPVDGLHFQSIKMSKTYMEVDYLISFAKLKIHEDEKLTLIFKNQFGALPEKLKVKLHPVRAKAIHDINKVRLPDLCLIDGIIGMERKGPARGMPKPLGLIIAGSDALATDLFCCRLMGFRPNSVPHLKIALEQNLGVKDYQHLGDKPSRGTCKFRFTPWYVDLIKSAVLSLGGKKSNSGV